MAPGELSNGSLDLEVERAVRRLRTGDTMTVETVRATILEALGRCGVDGGAALAERAEGFDAAQLADVLRAVAFDLGAGSGAPGSSCEALARALADIRRRT